MAEARTIIPVNKQFQEMISNGVEQLSTVVSSLLKLQRKELKLKEKEEARESQLQNIQLAFQKKYKKMREKLTLTYFKEFVKGKFFTRMRNVLGKIASSATSWFFKIMKALLFLAIFDPKGKFLGSIIGFITKMVVWFVKALTRYIPQIISTIIYLVTEVIPPLLKETIRAIFSAFRDMFHTWSKQLMEKSPFFAKMLQWVGDAFGENGILTIFFTKLAGLFPIIFAGMGIIALVSKLMPMFKIMWKIGAFIIPKLITGIGYLFTALQWLVNLLIANPIVAVILGVVLAFMAILKWGDKIQVWFNDTFGKDSILAKSFNVLNVAVKEIWTYIKTLWQNIKIFFKEVSEIGVMSAVKNFFRRTLKAIWEGLKNIIPAIAGMIGSMFNAMFNTEIFSGLEKKVRELMNGIQSTFNDIINWFKAIGRVGIIDYAMGSDEEQESWKDLTRLQSQLKQKKETMGAGALTEKEKGILGATDEDAFRELAKQTEGTNVLENMYEKVGKQLETHEKTLKDNNKETKELTEAQKEANSLAKEDQKIQSFVSQAKSISEVKVFETANRGSV